MRFEIAHTWDGQPLPAEQHATVLVSLTADVLTVDIDAPYHGDPAPPGPPGPTDRLWEYEVVELFLLGPDARYLEIECGPHGHVLALSLHGVRNAVGCVVPRSYEAVVEGPRFRATARIHAQAVPCPIVAANTYAIAGVGRDRSFRAHHPVPGSAPDFHQLALFPRIQDFT